MGRLGNVWIIGAGGFARETLNVFRDAGRGDEVGGFLEEKAAPGRVVNDKPVKDWSALRSLPKDSRLIAAIGSTARGRLIDEAAKLGFGFDTAIHPSVNRAQCVKVREGCVVFANCVLTTQIDVGPHTILNLACTVGHDVTIGRMVTLSPGVHVSGRVTIEDEVFVGTGAVIIERVRIGRGAVIGAGTEDNKEVLTRATANGIPEKTLKV
jgi:sugar O-acyltransferase (sialic acid O-acetyltransferase NeuD family)